MFLVVADVVQQLNSSSLSRGFVMAASSTDDATSSNNTLSVQLVEETARRRQLRLLKNKYDVFY